MDYTGGGSHHPQYPQHLQQDFSQLSLNQTSQLGCNVGRPSRPITPLPYNQSQAVSLDFGKPHYNASQGLYPSQLQEPAPIQQLHQLQGIQQTNQDQLNSQFFSAKSQPLLGGTNQLSCPIPQQQPSPSSHANINFHSPHMAPVDSLTNLSSSPIRSSLGGAHLSSSTLSSSPRLKEGNIAAIQPATENLSNVGARSTVGLLGQLGGAQLTSSFPGTPQSQDKRASPLPPIAIGQSRLGGAQLGSSSSWDSANQTSPYQFQAGAQQVGQVGNVDCTGSNQYSSTINGQMLSEAHMQQHVQYHDQMQINTGYSSMQQQQLGYTGFNQVQPFPQNQNFQFNIDYINSSDPSAYQDYYYSDYQYNGSYNSSFESLDPNYLGTPVHRAPTPYGDETVEDLGPEEVRWFYKVEADKKWTPFIGYDSLRIEWKYRDLLQDVSPGGTKKEAIAVASENVSPKDEEKSEVVERIVVRGGLYEVDVKHRKCKSIYWKGEVFVISRGTWFYEGTWGPIEESLSDKLEYEHLLNFRGLLLSSQRVDDATKEVVHSLSIPEGHVDWFSASEVYLSSDGTSSRLMRSVGKKLGFQKTGYKLHRGYSIDATASDKPPDINHIVFVIHGIGQKMEQGRIIKNCTVLRENIGYLKQKYFPTIAKSNQTVEFFPVEWRSSLVLDAGVIESITPHKILNLRQMLNASFMDIMYYNSPLYREEVIKGLTGEMNRLYTMFTQRNPYFEANGGKVSIVAHSLGCVITYDIVIGWNPAQQFDEQLISGLLNTIDKTDSKKDYMKTVLKDELKDLVQSYKNSHSQPSLKFKIENFFCLGSPLAVFLALRTKNADGEYPDLIPPKLCKRLLNIFHPADPVAYRIEPLLCSQYFSIAPLVVHSYNSAEKVPYAEMPLEPIIVPREKDGERPKPDSETNTPVSSAPSTPVKGTSSSWSWWGLMKGNKRTECGFSSSQDANSAIQSKGGITDRADFVLREGSMESSYISAVTSHTAYWTNYDVAHFILSIMYPDILPSSSGKPDILKP